MFCWASRGRYTAQFVKTTYNIKQDFLENSDSPWIGISSPIEIEK